MLKISFTEKELKIYKENLKNANNPNPNNKPAVNLFTKYKNLTKNKDKGYFFC